MTLTRRNWLARLVLEETTKTFIAPQKKLAKYALDEIDRIVKVFGRTF